MTTKLSTRLVTRLECLHIVVSRCAGNIHIGATRCELTFPLADGHGAI